MFTRYFSSNRKILFLSFLTGLFTALLLGALQFYWSYHKRDVRFDTLITDLSVYMESYFDELKMSIDTLQPLTLNSCEEVSAALPPGRPLASMCAPFCWSGIKTPTALPPPAR